MSTSDIIQGVFSCVSAVSAAAAAYFALSTIRENKKNAFIHHRYSLALTVKELFFSFQRDLDSFKISKHPDIHRALLDSEYYVSEELYKKFRDIIFELKCLEGERDLTKRISKTEGILKLIKDVKLDSRLDE
ncbi:hypothetical protein [Vibrio anguillarum]|uniref:hypothetical protein n=1 Tax=Vibrio anguillarum TaxID=55601 RepID=UPI001C9D594B|nr:hypothetical protein [Vibrio anguillarum]MBY7669192.1 hypothetical protein [Vibrio anguillarum]